MQPVSVIIEMDVERDRKECIKLNYEADSGNRKLAQWLLDHPIYTGAQVAVWLDCSKTRINDLRQWAADGFQKNPSEKRRDRASREKSQTDRSAGREALESLDNLEPQEEIADPAGFIVAIAKNASDKANIAVRNLQNNFTSDDQTKIIEAIDALIRKWNSVKRKIQTKLKKGSDNG